MTELKPNANKKLEIEVNGEIYQRLPVKTEIIKPNDTIEETILKYAKPHLQEGDWIFISEKIIAIMQGRSYPIDEIHPSFWAKFFSKYVLKTSYGIGLGSPWTMQLAIEEAGLCRIFLGAFAAVITKPFGIRGVFYKVVGKRVNAIDGPCEYTVPPYNKCAKLPPKDPNKVAMRLKEATGHEIIIIDANDLGVEVLGNSNLKLISPDLAKAIFKDNPLGQTNEQTPICVVRRAASSE